MNNSSTQQESASNPIRCVTDAPVITGPESIDLNIDQLWRQRQKARLKMTAVRRQIDEAENKMPWWAVPGYQFINCNGEGCGDIVGWPAIQGVEPPTGSGAMRLIRPSLRQIRSRPLQSRQYRHMNTRELLDRIRAQRIEQAKVGLPALHDAYDQAEGIFWEAENRLLDFLKEIQLPDGRRPAMAVAAQLLVEVVHHCEPDDTADPWEATALYLVSPAFAHLLPDLIGSVRDVVAEIVDNPDKPIGKMAIWE